MHGLNGVPLVPWRTGIWFPLSGCRWRYVRYICRSFNSVFYCARTRFSLFSWFFVGISTRWSAQLDLEWVWSRASLRGGSCQSRLCQIQFSCSCYQYFLQHFLGFRKFLDFVYVCTLQDHYSLIPGQYTSVLIFWVLLNFQTNCKLSMKFRIRWLVNELTRTFDAHMHSTNLVITSGLCRAPTKASTTVSESSFQHLYIRYYFREHV